MAQLERARFDHVGIVTTEQQSSESWVEPSRVWVTNPREHPYHVEFLRFEPDTPVTGPLRTDPHVAYRVDDLEQAIAGHEVVLAPFDPSGQGFARVAFVSAGGALVEFIEYADPAEEGWF